MYTTGGSLAATGAGALAIGQYSVSLAAIAAGAVALVFVGLAMYRLAGRSTS